MFSFNAIEGEDTGLEETQIKFLQKAVMVYFLKPVFTFQFFITVTTDGEDAGLVDSGSGGAVIGAALQHLKAAKGEEAAKAAWAGAGTQLPAFLFSVRRDAEEIWQPDMDWCLRLWFALRSWHCTWKWHLRLCSA